MDLTIAGDTIAYEPNDDDLAGLTLEFAAFDGSVGIGQVPIRDTSSTLAYATGAFFSVREIDTLLLDGIIVDHDAAKGVEKVTDARLVSYSVADPNILLDGFRVIRNRPEETDVARVLAMYTLDNLDMDTTWVLNTHTVTMPAKKYKSDGGWTSELIPDLVELTGKTLFVHDKANGVDGDGRCLHYHRLTDGHTAGLSISDVLSAVNGTTVFAPGNPTRDTTAIDLRNNVRGDDQENRIAYAEDATSQGVHNEGTHRYEAYLQFEATSQANLQSKVNAYLLSQKDDYVTYTCSIGPLDATALALIRVGDLITVTSYVMGLTAAPKRIAHMRLKVFVDGGVPAPGLWTAELELGAPRRRRRSGKGAKPNTPVTGPPIFTNPCTFMEDSFNRANTSFSTTGGGTADSGQVWVAGSNFLRIQSNRMDVTGAADSITFDQNDAYLPQDIYQVPVTGAFDFITSLSGEQGFFIVCNDGDIIIKAYTDTGTGDLVLEATDGTNTVTSSATPGVLSDPIGVDFEVNATEVQVVFDGNSRTVDLGNATPAAIADITKFDRFSWYLSITGGGTFTVEDLSIQYDCVDIGPLPGQPVVESIGTGDGADVTWATDYPYRPGSLKLYVNGVRIFAFTQTDPDAGTFTFATAPANGSEIYAEYQGQD